MSALALVLALTVVAGNLDEDCPASLIFRVPGLLAEDAAKAQDYANCISPAALPVTDKYADKLAQCAGKRPAHPNVKLTQAVAWVDSMAADWPGCETRLEIKKK